MQEVRSETIELAYSNRSSLILRTLSGAPGHVCVRRPNHVLWAWSGLAVRKRSSRPCPNLQARAEAVVLVETSGPSRPIVKISADK